MKHCRVGHSDSAANRCCNNDHGDKAKLAGLAVAGYIDSYIKGGDD